MSKVEKDLKKIFSLVLNIKEKEINDKFSSENSNKWDSLQHMNLILAIEQSFNIKFSSNELNKLFSFADILKILKNKK